MLAAGALLAVLAGGAAAGTGEGPKDCIPGMRRTLSPCFKSTGKRVKVAFFDADSTLRVSKSGSPAANHPTDVLALPMVAPKLRELANQGYLITIASNQAGIESGFVTYETADQALRYAIRLLTRRRGIVHAYDFAEKRDEHRKPGTGMAKQLAAALVRQGLEVDWEGSIMVGDSAWKRGKDTEPDGRPGEDVGDADRLFADAVRAELAGGKGFAFHHPRDFFGWVKYGVRNFHDVKALEAFRKQHPKVR